MEIPDELLCLFSERIEKQKGTYTVTIPEQEIADGSIHENGTYRVALLRSQRTAADSSTESTRSSANPGPPVEEGERRRVEIEEIGEQGDGIASVERGYIVIIPETEQHEHVTIEITSVTPRFAFADVVERETNEE